MLAYKDAPSEDPLVKCSGIDDVILERDDALQAKGVAAPSQPPFIPSDAGDYLEPTVRHGGSNGNDDDDDDDSDSDTDSETGVRLLVCLWRVQGWG